MQKVSRNGGKMAQSMGFINCVSGHAATDDFQWNHIL